MKGVLVLSTALSSCQGIYVVQNFMSRAWHILAESSENISGCVILLRPLNSSIPPNAVSTIKRNTLGDVWTTGYRWQQNVIAFDNFWTQHGVFCSPRIFSVRNMRNLRGACLIILGLFLVNRRKRPSFVLLTWWWTIGWSHLTTVHWLTLQPDAAEWGTNLWCASAGSCYFQSFGPEVTATARKPERAFRLPSTFPALRARASCCRLPCDLLPKL